MIKHFCDRCGKETAFESLSLNKFYINPSIGTEISKDSLYLCPDCQKELAKWVRDAKEATGQRLPADELVVRIEEKIENLTRIGDNICFYVREVTRKKPDDQNAWLALGQLMREWEGEIKR